eukprot:11329868-Ditylum_brightwellii.AAC.2
MIDCKMDTRKVLTKSIVEPLNEGIKTPIQSGGVKVDCDLTTKKFSVSAIAGWVPKNEMSQLLLITIFISGVGVLGATSHQSNGKSAHTRKVNCRHLNQ